MVVHQPPAQRHLSNGTHSRPYPAQETLLAREAVADYITKYGVPNTVLQLRLAVRDAWLELLTVVPSTAHPECSDFTIVHQDRIQGGHVFAYHAPTAMVFPAVTGTDPADVSWLLDLARSLAQG